MSAAFPDDVFPGDVFPDKAAARQVVWDRLQAEGLAVVPLPPRGRIPNFRGAGQAAENLFALPPWRDARRMKVNPDTAQAPVRAAALRRGITVYVATPRLAGGFRRFDPAAIPPDRYDEAAQRANWDRWAQDVALEDLPAMDAIVVGSVAVTRDGRRAGKGAGYADLEFAILRDLGHPPVPVATTVHDRQIVGSFPVTATDLPLSAVVTPSGPLTVPAPPPAPTGVAWAQVSPAMRAEMPILQALWERAGRPTSRGG